jgi:hypothetical protein
VSYLDELAAQIEANVPEELLPDGDSNLLFRLYALLALAKGGRVGPEDVHNAWAVWMTERDPQHRSLKPFAELDSETRAADEPFVHAIRTAARSLRS